MILGRPVNKRKRCDRQQFLLSRAAFMLSLILSVTFAFACARRGELPEQAQVAWDRGDYQTAALKYEEFLKVNPHHDQVPTVRFKVANIYYYNLRQYDRAIQQYIHLIEDYPNSTDIAVSRQRLAECYAALSKYREAINEYERLLGAAPEGIDRRRIRLNIADLYYDLNDLGQALAEYEKVTQDWVYDALAERAWLRISGIRFLRDEFEEALQAYRTVADGASEPMIKRQARYGMIDCYERTFQYDLAIKLLEETGADPKNAGYIERRIASMREQQRQRNFSHTIESQR